MAPTVVAVRMVVDIRRAQPDTDKDKIKDPFDHCPTEAEDYDGYQDGDGCPDSDNDGDRVCDAWIDNLGVHSLFAGQCRGRDLCPTQKEDIDGFQDTDGCLDPDNDHDGICDRNYGNAFSKICKGVDKCPLQPEDFDLFQDEDGCRDPDNDGDGVPDSLDACPNGAPDSLPGGKNGCPILQEVTPVVAEPVDSLTQTAMASNWIFLFEIGSDNLGSDSDSTIAQIQKAMSSFADAILKIEGHADIRGNAEYNQELSERRARRVLEVLVQKGINPKRIQVRGTGFSSPIRLNFEEEGRAQNRRVDVKLERPAK